MAKKPTNRQRQAARDKARRAERTLALEAARRDEHARLVAERHGDPRFVQRVRTATGYDVTLNPETPAGRDFQEALAAQRVRFREKFGREMSDDDPLIFDPDADEPTPLTEATRNAVLDEFASSLAGSGALDPAYIYAWRDVGYMITESNQHLFSAAEVQTYLDAVADHMNDATDDDEDWDEAMTGPTQQDILMMTGDELEDVVTAILQERNLTPIEQFLDEPEEFVLSPQSAQTLIESAFGVLACWLLGARQQKLDASAVMAWIAQNLPAQVGDDVRQLGGMIGFVFAPDLTVAQAAERLGARFIPTLTALAAGVAATAGDGDARWLRQFDPDVDTHQP